MIPLDWREGDFARRVVDWQRTHGRHGLPWQSREPYRVWLSEVMLQQTQVSTVLAYYTRFLARFPDVATLAAAPLDDVLAAWSGLGYYRRARFLHACAQAVVERHGGRFPQDPEQLAALPGIGRSTAAAIAAFCFDRRAAILDGNVKRLLARALGFGADLAVASHERELWQAACALLPAEPAEMPAYTQGLMDLGATVCTPRRPTCLVCPLRAGCVALATGRVEQLPVKTRKLQRGRRANAWLWVEHAGRVWLQQRAALGVWAGLWSLPMFDDEDSLLAAAAGVPLRALAPIEHALTHFDWRLAPWHAEPRSADEAEALVARLGGADAGRWIARAALADIALPAPLRKLLVADAATSPAP
ncbi:MAG TPA: A/G-specific adenine glycosylase [Methylibium sp.]|uniref:A/G-specific adenine glycosylase n=1 Tax=Methylibium sp. TaxID=2067992 RepID=UPI002DB55C86|nr:A/G-specific adenine glycosylase [Methylibium sp.]HEU4457905.1 A/G-specific adenine glycosylase [Methylibium sp.]